MAAQGRQRFAGIWRGLLLGLLPSVALSAASPAFAQVGYSSIVVEAASGKVLEAENPDALRHPASLAKLMTLYLTFEALRDRRITLDMLVPASAHCSSMQPTKLGLVPGSRLTVQQAILGLVTKSANDAACALGELLGGSEGRFAQMMTLRARALGMNRTIFANASGLPDPDEWTSAHDMAVLARRLITDFPADYHYFSTPSFVYQGRFIPNHDTMLKVYPGADGLKTGYTDASGHNLVTSAVRDGVRLIGVVLGAGSNGARDLHMTAILNQGYQEMDVAVGPRTRLAGRFGLVAAAHAATIDPAQRVALPARAAELTRKVTLRERAEPEPAHRAAAHEAAETPSGWTIQVGSFRSEHAARVAAAKAHRVAERGDPHIEAVRLRHHTLWRAQVVGLSVREAHLACSHLARHRTSCVILRPETREVASR
jgi:D-alanyl-D-alanine carboxypeptidase